MNINIIEKLEKAKLLGRGGASFPTSKKWEVVKKISSKKKYIVCNCSEGEPSVKKDGYILKHYPKQVIEGIKLALETINNSEAYLYLRKDYYSRYKDKLKKLIKDLPITIFKEKGNYLSGEETSLCEEIEGKEGRPRQKPPYPSQSGIYNCPTLINNLETFCMVSKIYNNEYKKTRFYTLSGDIKNPGVYELPISYSIKKILEETNNLPKKDFFLQIGGGMSGEVILPKEMNRKVRGSGSIIIYDRKNTDPYELMRRWVNFFLIQNCDKCTPCREGVYRIYEMLKENKIDKKTLNDLFLVMDQSSFCALGAMIVIPFKSLTNKVLKI